MGRTKPRSSAARVLTDLCYAWESKMNGLNDATIGEDVIVRESPGKGKGVFALRALSAEVRGRSRPSPLAVEVPPTHSQVHVGLLKLQSLRYYQFYYVHYLVVDECTVVVRALP